MKKIFRHNDFTAEFSDEGTDPNNRYFSFTGKIDGDSGACGDKIAEIYPPFQILEDLHLAKLDGTPMYALEHGFYFFEQSGWNIAKLEDYWHVKLTDNQKTRCLESGVNAHGANTGEPTKLMVAKVMEEIRPQWQAMAKAAYRLVKATPEDLTEINEDIDIEDFNEPDKVRALADFLDVHFSIIEEDGDDEYTAEGTRYLVLTDEEADDAWDKELDNYLEEIIYPELPDNIRNYFDDNRWKEDAKTDGRGHSLGRYDGEEHKIKDPESGELFYVYRQ